MIWNPVWSRSDYREPSETRDYWNPEFEPGGFDAVKAGQPPHWELRNASVNGALRWSLLHGLHRIAASEHYERAYGRWDDAAFLVSVDLAVALMASDPNVACC